MIQKWLQEMISNSRAENNGDREKLNQGIGFTTPTSGLKSKAKRTQKLISGLEFNSMVTAAASRNSSSTGRNMQNVSAASNRESSGVSRNYGFIKSEPDLPEMVQNMVRDYYKNWNP
ncbi:hypothetical protein CRYUN_Cryun13aG0123200 [Craigia yunnanensis]